MFSQRKKAPAASRTPASKVLNNIISYHTVSQHIKLMFKNDHNLNIGVSFWHDLVWKLTRKMYRFSLEWFETSKNRFLIQNLSFSIHMFFSLKQNTSFFRIRVFQEKRRLRQAGPQLAKMWATSQQTDNYRALISNWAHF